MTLRVLDTSSDPRNK